MLECNGLESLDSGWIKGATLLFWIEWLQNVHYRSSNVGPIIAHYALSARSRRHGRRKKQATGRPNNRRTNASRVLVDVTKWMLSN